MSTVLARCRPFLSLLLAAALSRPGAARGEEMEASTPQAHPGPAAFELFGALGYEHGFTRPVRLLFADGSSQGVSVNGGLTLALGAGLFPLLDGRLQTRVTAGVKVDWVLARNGSVRYLAFPLELVELWSASPHVRLGAGLSLALLPRLRGSGIASAIQLDLDPSLGILLQAEYVWRFGSGRTVTLGPRLLLQRMRSRESGVVDSANALGLQVGATL